MISRTFQFGHQVLRHPLLRLLHHPTLTSLPVNGCWSSDLAGIVAVLGESKSEFVFRLELSVCLTRSEEVPIEFHWILEK